MEWNVKKYNIENRTGFIHSLIVKRQEGSGFIHSFVKRQEGSGFQGSQLEGKLFRPECSKS